MSMRLITGPSTTPVSVAEIKRRLREESDDQNGEIESLIESATAYFDGYAGVLGRAMISQTWELVLDRFPARDIRFPLGPLISIESIKYDDVDGAEQTVDSANYDVDTAREPGWIVPVTGYTWPQTYDAINAVRVRGVCGFGTEASDVPAPVRDAIKLLVAHRYTNREAVSADDLKAIPHGVDAMITPYRRVLF